MTLVASMPAWASADDGQRDELLDPYAPDGDVRIGWRSLRHVCPHLTPEQAREVALGLGLAFARFDIRTTQRVTAAIALLAHESDGFTTACEDTDGAEYEGRRDLGNTRPGDGLRYRGRGRILVVGRANYRDVSQALGCNFIRTPELLARSPWAELAGGLWWHRNGCNDLADRGDLGEIASRLDPEHTGPGNRWAHHRRAQRVARWLLPRAPSGDGAPGY